ncbi:phosphotransferase [Verrucomicrobium sp. BvORR106]|uniref:phosphotransferase enzyme family protein n=1 Tax=Verrucomicrobium sp. BvORR106 TaxID=1403819 RepID=UPI000570A2CB|nr:phosphotransferase [Verrucomicrobium sp. BvORR106]
MKFTGAQLQTFVEPYGIPVDGLQHLGSSQNHVYRARHPSGADCVVRISEGRHRTKAEVEAELEWVSHLSSMGLRVCPPLLTEEGVTCVEGSINGQTCLVTCFEQAPGEKVKAADLGPDLYRKLGALVGQLHAGVATFETSGAEWKRPHWHQSRLICQDLAALEGQVSDAFRSSVADLVDSLRSWPVDSSTYGPVHGDVSLGNCHLHEGELWLFDFDNAEHGYFAQDLATVLYDSVYCKVLNKFADPGLTDRMLPLWQAVWDGYQETGLVKELDAEQMRKFFLLREAVIYIHYHRVLDVKTVSESFKTGLEVMRENVERQEHQVEFAVVFRGDTRLQDTRRKS